MTATESEAYDRGFLEGIATRQSVRGQEIQEAILVNEMGSLRTQNRRLRAALTFACAVFGAFVWVVIVSAVVG